MDLILIGSRWVVQEIMGIVTILYIMTQTPQALKLIVG